MWTEDEILAIPDKGIDCRGITYQRVSLSSRMEDQSGIIHGRLLPLFPILKPNTNKKEWLCLCSCGNIKVVNSSNLKSEKITSCGCLRSETTANHITAINHARKEDFTGRTIKDLYVLELDKEMSFTHSQNGSIHYYWKCQCTNCNNIMSLRVDTLKDTKRVYCRFCNATKSVGEILIRNLLLQNNIPFTEEQTFSNCIFPDTKAKAKFDFYVNNQYLIEYDGTQHFRASSMFPDISKIQEHDYIKNLWCYQNNIPLIRIPYSHVENIKIEDLRLETTQYRMEYENGRFIIKSKATSLYC